MYSRPFDKKFLNRQYIDYTPYKLLDWIDPNKLNESYLSYNDRAVDYIIKNYNVDSFKNRKGRFYMFPNSLIILENKKYWDRWHLYEYWNVLSTNPAAYNLILYKIDYEEGYDRPYKDWKRKLNWSSIPVNPCMLPILERRKYSNKYDINEIGRNPNPLCMKVIFDLPFNDSLLNNVCLNDNYDVMPYIYKHIDKLTDSDWKNLSSNKYAIKLLEKNIDKINWDSISLNSKACHIIEKNLDKINWRNLSSNSGALYILGQNIEKIDWWYFINENTNPDTINLIENNIDKFDWKDISLHENLIPLLEKNKDKIDYECLSANRSIFTIDYEALENRIKDFKNELLEYTWHPDRFKDWCLTNEEKENFNQSFINKY